MIQARTSKTECRVLMGLSGISLTCLLRVSTTAEMSTVSRERG